MGRSLACRLGDAGLVGQRAIRRMLKLIEYLIHASSSTYCQPTSIISYIVLCNSRQHVIFSRKTEQPSPPAQRIAAPLGSVLKTPDNEDVDN